MAGNPWKFLGPFGSHDLISMDDALRQWRRSGLIEAPRFDKALRQGRGDRCGSTTAEANVVLLEGWFLGVVAGNNPAQLDDATLSEAERSWRPRAIEALRHYGTIWDQLDDLWHLRATRTEASSRWKEEQLITLKLHSGVDFNRGDLSDFNRMVQTALPPIGCSSLTKPMWWWISATAEALKRSTETTISSLLRRLQPLGRQILERDRSTRIYRWKEHVVQRWQLWLSTPHDAGCACFSRFSSSGRPSRADLCQTAMIYFQEPTRQIASLCGTQQRCEPRAADPVRTGCSRIQNRF